MNAADIFDSAEVVALRAENQSLQVRVKQLEASIESSAEAGGEDRHFRQTLDSIAEGFQIIAFDWTYLYVNAKAASHGRKPASELIGHTMMHAYPGIEDTPMFGHLQRCMNERVAQTLTNKFEYADGGFAWFDLHIEPVPDGISVLSLEITEQKRADDLLRQNEQRLRVLLEQLPAVIWTVDKDLHFTSAGGSKQGDMGRSPADFVGQHLSAYFVPAEGAPDAVLAAHQQALMGHSSKCVYEPEGAAFDAHVEPMRNDGGDIVGVVGVALNVIEHRRVERQLWQAQKMESVGRLAGGIAHDFNNILTVIKSFGSFVDDALEPGSVAKEDVREVLDAADRAASLTQQLLVFSRRQTVMPRAVDLNALAESLDRMLRRLIGEDVELVTIHAAHAWPVRIDPNDLEQVIVNLAVNARDAMPMGGKLIIETANISIDEACSVRKGVTMPPGQYVMLAVADNGCGMAADVRTKVFEPFFTTKGVGTGTGLGLSTCHGIIKQAGGYIWVYSEVDSGTTFKIYLPRHAAAAAVPIDAVALQSLRGNETILVVEDDPQVRALATRALSQRGYQVIEALDPHVALSLATSHAETIHLLLTDVVMPHMNGRELAEKISGMRPETKVLYMSGYTENTVVHHGVLKPGISLLQKPFTPEILAKKVRALLDRA